MFFTHGEEPPLKGLTARIAERTVPAAQIFSPLLDESMNYRLLHIQTPEAVVNLDWHNDMSKLILDINARMRQLRTTVRAGLLSGSYNGRSRKRDL